MQFKVPQNIDMEDKIIGPLTLTQFFYLLFGGLVIYILFSKLALTGFAFFFWILALPIGLLSFAMAFVKVQDRPFPSFIVALIKYATQPRSRTWQHYEPPQETVTKAKTKAEPSAPRKTLDTLQVGELAQVLDKPRGTDGQK